AGQGNRRLFAKAPVEFGAATGTLKSVSRGADRRQVRLDAEMADSAEPVEPDPSNVGGGKRTGAVPEATIQRDPARTPSAIDSPAEDPTQCLPLPATTCPSTIR